MYKGNALGQQKSNDHSRRDMLKVLLLNGGALVLGSVAAPFVVNEYYKRKSAGETRYFKVLKKGDETYVEDKVYGQNRVFKIAERNPVLDGRGVTRLVQEENPQYNDADAHVVAQLAVQLYENPTLKNLKEGEIVKIPYNNNKTIKAIYKDRKYPIPKEIKGIKSLEDVLKNAA